ncbi:MAG: hypothetical protein NTY35_14155 [Planctomycetota bacterium]|nr:hypothetical protein [Planctomycetota bacterium]
METQKPAHEALLDLLVEEGAVDRAVAEAVRTRHRETWVPLGKILRQKGWLSMGQLVEVLQLQAGHPGLRLGEIALQRGFCSASQLAEALRIQSDLSPHILELVAGTQGLDPDRILRALSRYVRALEARIPATPAES